MKADSGIETVFRIKILFAVEQGDSFPYPGVYIIRVEAERFVIIGDGGTGVVGLGDTFISH